jgi:hypothetical protein
MSDTPPSTYSVPFAEMSARIDHNTAADFGGALVIVPPSGEPLTMLVLDGNRDPALFWAAIGARIAVVVKQAEKSADGLRRDPWGQAR